MFSPKLGGCFNPQASQSEAGNYKWTQNLNEWMKQESIFPHHILGAEQVTLSIFVKLCWPEYVTSKVTMQEENTAELQE